MKEFIVGFNYLLQGLGYITRPGLRRYFIIPLFLNILVFALLTYYGFGFIQQALGWLIPEGESIWLDISRVLSLIILTPVLVIAVFLVASTLANFVASPFNDFLSERIEIAVKGSTGPDKKLLQVIAGMGPVMLGELRKYLYFGVIFLLITILTITPIINLIFLPVAPFVWIIFGAWMLSLEYLAYPMQNHQQTFAQTREFARSRRMRTMGFGLAVLLTTLIPLVNFIVIPAAVAGATLFWINTGTDARKNTKSQEIN